MFVIRKELFLDLTMQNNNSNKLFTHKYRKILFNLLGMKIYKTVIIIQIQSKITFLHFILVNPVAHNLQRIFS